MCVILAVPVGAEDITPDEWDKATHANSDGYGIAWLEKGMVRFTKLSYRDSLKVKDWRPPQPYIMHFRLATVGGEVAELCHPFIVSPKSKLTLRGRAHEVLFHNGHWSEWNEWLALTYSGLGKLPKGEFSDSRAMASMVGHYGESILEISGATQLQRIALFNKKGEISYHGNGWSQGKDGVTRSNEGHLYTYGSHYYYDKDDSPRLKHQVNNTCVVCQEPYLTYDADDGICHRCDMWEGSAPPVPVKTIGIVDKEHCVACGSYTHSTYNKCNSCRELNIEFNCRSCKKELYLSQSIAVQCCDGCRRLETNKQDAMHVNAWYAIKNHLRNWTQNDRGVFIVPATFSIWEGKDDKYLEYIVLGQTGDNDPKESLFFEGHIKANDFKYITSSLMEWEKDEEELRKSMLTRA